MKRYIYINDDESSQYLYCDNRISNRKYTLLNFLPKNLWEQFSRFMNQYFLLIACLQLWSLITPVNPASTWGPLIFIFAVSATKEAWDDYNRYLSDKKANGKEVWVVRQGIKKHIKAQDIHVGNIVWLRENDEVPCDLVLIGTSEAQGLCYVETSALDGETDLKTRVIPPTCMGIDLELLHKIKGLIECPNPDKDIRRFDANLRLFPPFIDNDMCPLTIKNTLLQSCYLRNTEWACGVAVYTGNETKLGMSRGIPEPKLTAVDAMIDKLTGAIFVFQIVVVIVLGVAGNVWKDTEARKQWYVLYPEEGPWYELLVIPLRFELLCSIMIPISIKVSLDLVKSLYAKFIDWDNEMIDRETSTPAHATNTAISEDLGQVEYILTDKTGTLTENRMIFRRCCINGIFYGNENGNALKDEELINAVAGGSSDVIRFLTVMAICNTVIPIQSKSGSILYKAQSQDEDALVHAAAQLHMVFVNKNSNILEIKFNASTIQYEALEILEFTSDRKRMSVVVKDCQNGRIILLSKGADEAILPYACAGGRGAKKVEVVAAAARVKKLAPKRKTIATERPIPSKRPHREAEPEIDTLRPSKRVKKLAKKGDRKIHVVSSDVTGTPASAGSPTVPVAPASPFPISPVVPLPGATADPIVAPAPASEPAVAPAMGNPAVPIGAPSTPTVILEDIESGSDEVPLERRRGRVNSSLVPPPPVVEATARPTPPAADRGKRPMADPEATAESPIHPQDADLPIPPQEVSSAYPSWELELDALLQSTTGEAGSSAAPAEPAGAMPEAEVFVKLREVLSLTASQALRCQGLDSVGECLNDLASGGHLSPEGISFLTDLLERTRHHFLIFERALQAEDDLKVAKVAQEAGRVELEAIKARKAKLTEFDRQISDLERQISVLRQQRAAAASELEKDFEANKARLTAFAAGARRIQQLQCNKKTRQAEIILSEAKWLELKAALETFLPSTP